MQDDPEGLAHHNDKLAGVVGCDERAGVGSREASVLG